MKINSRQELIKSLCLVISNNTDKSVEANNLLKKLLSNTISVNDCISEYNNLVGITTSANTYFIDKYHNKPLGKSLHNFTKHKLSIIETAKLLSSLVTHSLIEINLGTEVDTGLPQLLTLLNKIVISNYTNDYYDEVYKVLDKYKYILHK